MYALECAVVKSHMATLVASVALHRPSLLYFHSLHTSRHLKSHRLAGAVLNKNAAKCDQASGIVLHVTLERDVSHQLDVIRSRGPSHQFSLRQVVTGLFAIMPLLLSFLHYMLHSVKWFQQQPPAKAQCPCFAHTPARHRNTP